MYDESMAQSMYDQDPYSEAEYYDQESSSEMFSSGIGDEHPLTQEEIQSTYEQEYYEPQYEDQTDAKPQSEFDHQTNNSGGKVALAKDFMNLAQSIQSGDAEVALSAIEKFSKSQLVRLLDVTVLGPLLLFYAYKGKLSSFERVILGIIGAGTISYNLRNYMKNKKVIQPKELEAIKSELKSAQISGR